MTMQSRICAILPLLVASALFAFDNAHFYRAPNYFNEPRLEEKWLSTFEALFAGGATYQSRNSCGDKTCLLNIYGTENFRLLGAGVPCKDPTNPEDLVLIELEQIPVPEGSCFGRAQFNGRFSELEFAFNYIQNFSRGFFFQAQIPVRRLEISPDCCHSKNDTPELCSPIGMPFTDFTPCACTPTCPNDANIVWQNFLNLFPQILNRYGLCAGPVKEWGAGDLSLLVGWTNNYQETDLLDFIDITVKTGVLAPTGKKRNENEIFSIPIGYNGHWGIPASLDVSFGTYEWLTMGAHVGAIFFLDRCYCVRMKTDCNQSGFVRLACAPATVKEGTVVECGAYLKADHFVRGLSAMIGYAYTAQHDTLLTPQDSCVFDPCIVNSDDRWKNWQMHSLSFIAEYDFTKKNARFGPRLGLAYNLIVGGKRIFNTSTGSAGLSLDISWNFD